MRDFSGCYFVLVYRFETIPSCTHQGYRLADL